MKWPATQELHQAEEQFTSQPMLQECQVAAAWAEHTTIFEWRAMTPAKFSESRECVVQLLPRSQTLEGLPKKFSQLSVSSLSQHPPASYAVMVLAQPTFTFGSQGNMTPLSGVSPLFHSA